jgi:tetratricopeptide (TPR) repeat protein
LGSAELVARGRAEISQGRPEQAAALFKQALAQTPNDPSIYVNLAEAYRRQGNEPGAILALKQAESMGGGGSDPSLMRARADLFLKMHAIPNAIAELDALAALDFLTDKELRELALLLAHQGKIDEALRRLEQIQRREPDDPETKVVEAEVLWVKGDELLAARLMDRLLDDTPGLTSARLLRARYFLWNLKADKALEDLTLVNPSESKRSDVVLLQAAVLNELERTEEAATLLERHLEEAPKSAEALSLLAETRLLQRKRAEAETLVEKALGLEPRWPRALYVRGWAMELQGKLEEAQLDYETAIKSDPAFGPASSRLWRLYEQRGMKSEAIGALERLDRLSLLSTSEKVTLAGLYADTWVNLDRGRALIDEALKRDPKDPTSLAIRARLDKGKKRPARSPGIEIIRGR